MTDLKKSTELYNKASTKFIRLQMILHNLDIEVNDDGEIKFPADFERRIKG